MRVPGSLPSALPLLALPLGDSDAVGLGDPVQALGYPIAAESLGGGFRVAYIDTATEFGFYTEVVDAPSSFVDQVRGISDTCANWDGRDPVRIMTRGGYRVPDKPPRPLT